MGDTHLTGLSINGVSVTTELPLISGTAAFVKVAQGSLIAGTGTSGGELLAVANPEGAACFIVGFMIDITTQATGVATGDFGVAASATTTSATLIDTIDIGTGAILGDNIEDGGTGGGGVRAWSSSQYVTGTPSATAAGLVGTYKIYYIVA